MRHKIIGLVLAVGAILVTLALAYELLGLKEAPDEIQYGASFNVIYAEELGLDWKEVYRAMLDELGVKRVRFAAHWTLVEPNNGVFNFEELDYELAEAEKRNVEVILAVGRRLPRWPECHIPGWAKELSWEEQKEEIREYIEEVVTRYKDHSAITHWQVENEPFLSVFAKEYCGDLDVSFLEEEIALVKSLDPTRPILLTDSGNLGTWYGAYSRADVFGTSVYVFLWNPDVGPFRTILPPSVYRVKEKVMKNLLGEKPTLLTALSAEPSLLRPVTETPINTQYERMDLEKFGEIVEYAAKTRLSPQYLWGIEWWYYLKEHGDDSMWEYAKTLFR